MKKKLALLLAFSLVLSLVPASALFAQEDEDNGYENGEVYYDEDVDLADEDADVADEDADDEDADNGDVDGDADADNGFDDVEPYFPVPVEENPVPDFTPAPGAATLIFVIGEATFTRNGVVNTLDAAPFIDADAGRTMVPLAAIAEGLGATVGWDGETRNVSIVRGAVSLTLNVDTELPDGMGMPAIVEDRTFVPVAYVANELGATVAWDEDAQSVTIVD